MAKLTPEQFAERLGGVSARAAKRLRKQLTASALDAETYAKLNATGAPKVRTDRLRSSIQGRVKDLTISLRAGGTAVRYARIQEYGGTVRPRRSRFLAVPLDAAKTGAGVSRYASPRDVPDTYIITGSDGSPVIMQKVEKGDDRPMFVLRRQVTIRKKLYLTKAIVRVAKEMPADLIKVVRHAVVDVGRS